MQSNNLSTLYRCSEVLDIPYLNQNSISIPTLPSSASCEGSARQSLGRSIVRYSRETSLVSDSAKDLHMAHAESPHGHSAVSRFCTTAGTPELHPPQTKHITSHEPTYPNSNQTPLSCNDRAQRHAASSPHPLPISQALPDSARASCPRRRAISAARRTHAR